MIYLDKELYTPEGKLSLSNCDRSYSILLFDSELNLINEINLQNLESLGKSIGHIKWLCSSRSAQNLLEKIISNTTLNLNSLKSVVKNTLLLPYLFALIAQPEV